MFPCEFYQLYWGISFENYNYNQNILRLLIFYWIFFSSQVNQSVIISNQHGIYVLPHELPKNLRL